MLRLSLSPSLLGLLLLTLATSPLAGADFDPAARAATIAPFLDEQAFGVVHVDLARIDLTEARKYALAKLPAIQANEQEELTRNQENSTRYLKLWRTSGVEEVFIVASLTDTPRRPPFFVIPLKKEADAQRIGELFFPKAPAGAEPGGAADAPYGWAVIRGHLCLGHTDAIARLKTMKPTEHPQLAQGFKVAGDTAVQLVLLQSGDTRRVLEETLARLPGPLGEFSGKDLAAINFAAVGINLPPKPAIKLEVHTTDETGAVRLHKLATTALASGKDDPVVKLAVPNYDELMTLLIPQQDGARLSLALTEDNDGIRRALSLVLPQVQAARQAAQRMQGMNNLKQLALAMHIHHDANRALPAACTAKAGKPLLSWRVTILPYIEQKELYDQFHHDEPWDSEHNQKLIAKMPQIFAPPGMGLAEGHTTYLVPNGKGLVFDGDQAMTFSKITDGLSNTIMIVEANAAHAVPWTKPADLAIDLENPLKGLSDVREQGFLTALCDGSVKFMSKTIDPKTLRYLFEIADGMSVLHD